MIFLESIELLLFAICAFTVLYLLVYALASTNSRTDKYAESRIKHRFAILIPAYKDEEYIHYTIKSFLQQDYPIDCYDIIVISDHLSQEANRLLSQYPITLLQAKFKKSSKTKSVKVAMSQLADGQYDIVLIMNADNVVEKNFLEEINNTYASGSNAIQVHRIYQERPSNVSVLNAIADEINNSILRAGHVNLGLSASLNGSGAAFDFTWFKENIKLLKDNDDEKAIEALLLRERIYMEYLANTHVYALKDGGKKKFYDQRGSWIRAQYYSFFTNVGNLPGAILGGNFDYADRILQWFIFPRTLLLGTIALFSVLSAFIEWNACLKWWGLLLLLLFTWAIATPNYLVDKNFNKAVKAIPSLAAGMAIKFLFGRKK